MSGALSAMNFADDLGEVRGCEDAVRWSVETGSLPLEVLVKMTPVSHPEEAFQARLLWAEYPDKAPSLKFRNLATGALDCATAWPTGGPFRPTSLCACASYCSEGFQLHPEWVNDPITRWDPRGNVLLKVLRMVQDDLDTSFTGRHR